MKYLYPYEEVLPWQTRESLHSALVDAAMEEFCRGCEDPDLARLMQERGTGKVRLGRTGYVVQLLLENREPESHFVPDSGFVFSLVSLLKDLEEAVGERDAELCLDLLGELRELCEELDLHLKKLSEALLV